MNVQVSVKEPVLLVPWRTCGKYLRISSVLYSRNCNNVEYFYSFYSSSKDQTFHFTPSDPNLGFCASTFPSLVFPQPTGAPNFTPIFGASGGPTPTVEFPTGAAGLLAACPRAAASGLVVTALDSHFVNPLVHQFDLAYERELPGNMSFTASYVGSRGLRLPTLVDANLPPPDTTATYLLQDASGNNVRTFAVPFFSGAVPRPNPNVGVILMGKSVANSWYHSLVLRLHRKMTHGFSFDTNFTWSQARDDGQSAGVNGTFAGTDEPLNPFNLKSEYGLSDLDIRRRFVFTTYWEMPFGSWTQNDTMKHIAGGWKLSSVWRVQDGRPVTAFMDSFPFSCTLDGGLTCGLVSSFGGTDSGRVPFLARNAQFTSPGLFTTDLRIGREFKLTERAHLELLWEAFNLFNRTNVTGVDNDAFFLTSPSTGGFPTNCLTPPGAANFQGCLTPRKGFLSTQSTSNTLYGARQMQLGAKIRF